MRFRTLTAVLVAVAIGAAAVGFCGAQAEKQSPAPKPKNPAVHQTASTQGGSTEEGERVFNQNCSRCHNAPEGFSSRISGTIARHMRVRASLSQSDEQVLMRFLNP